MKIYSLSGLIGAAFMLQACALGALSESDIQLQPVLKPADHSQARVIDGSINSQSTQSSGATTYSDQGSVQQESSSKVKIHAMEVDELIIESESDIGIEPSFDSNSKSNAEDDIFSAQDEQAFNDRAATNNYQVSNQGIQYRGNDILSAPIQLAEGTSNNTELAGGGVTFLQVGMFRSEAGALQVQANAQAATDADVHINNESAGEYRVLVGPLTPDQVERVKAQLANAGLSYFRHLK